MPPVTPQKLKSCLSYSPSEYSTSSSASSTPKSSLTATPPTPYSTGSSSGYSTPTRKHKKSVRFNTELEQVKEYASVKISRTVDETERRKRRDGTTEVRKRRTEEVTEVKKRKEEAQPEVRRKRKAEDTVTTITALEVKKGIKRKELRDDREDSQYYESTVNKILESGPAGLGITVDSAYGPPPNAPPQAPLPRPTKRERTKYSQSPTTKSAEMKMTYSFDDSTSTTCYPDPNFRQAPPPPAPAQQSSFTEIANYPPVPQIMSTGYSFSEQQPDDAWWAYNQPQQPPAQVVASSSSRTLRRKRSFEARRQSDEPRAAPSPPELSDVSSMRSRRGSSKSTSSSSSSSKLPADHPVRSDHRVEKSSRRRQEEDWSEQYRLETMKKQARQKTRDREIKKHTRTDVYGSFGPDAGAGYFDKGPAYSFNAADDGYSRYF